MASPIFPRLVLLAALAGMALPTAAGAASNPLLGSWKFASTTSSFGPSSCPSAFVFKDGMAAITHPKSTVYATETVSNLQVHYVPSPTMVSVMAGNVVNYYLSDKNHMYTADPSGKCFYQRTG